MIIDSHIHVDQISRPYGKKPVDVDFNKVVQHIQDNNLDVAVLIYRNYETIEKIKEIFPKLRIIALYWVDVPVTIDDLKRHKQEVRREMSHELCYGLKLHNRGIFNQQSLDQIKEALSNTGLSKFKPHLFCNYENKYLFDLLRTLPDNKVVLCHTGGGSTSMIGAGTMEKMISCFPKLKFIVGHAGAYGGLDVAFPDPEKLTEKDTYPSYVDANSRQLYAIFSMYAAIVLAKRFENVYLDNTLIKPIKVKGKAFNLTDRVVIGTDFGTTNTNTNVRAMYKAVKTYKSDFDFNEMNKRFVDWIDTDWTVIKIRQLETNKQMKKVLYNNLTSFV